MVAKVISELKPISRLKIFSETGPRLEHKKGTLYLVHKQRKTQPQPHAWELNYTLHDFLYMQRVFILKRMC